LGFFDFESVRFKSGGVVEPDFEVKKERAFLKKLELQTPMGEDVGVEYHASL